jgi:hypothetical protein
MEINNIYKVTYQKNYDKYFGFLRNEKKFNIRDSVFVAYGNDNIFRGIIMGIELTDSDNPEAIYKIEIPKGLVHGYFDNDETNIKCNCDYIFSSLEEAKESRIRQANKMLDLELQNIEKFFKQFEKK